MLNSGPRRAKSPGQNGVRERAFGSLKYEHLYRHAEQIATLGDLYREAEACRHVFNEIRPHEALGMHRPTSSATRHCTPSARIKPKRLCQKLDARQWDEPL